ncbi:MAG: hypothetical protein JSS11_16740 [Verrucomicrobia bacterium]|nr:hypothetical protein [Verrucomicrobiota bacterium]
MKTMPAMGWLAAAACALLACGCSTTDTVDNRIKQNTAVYAGLTPEEQNQIRSGVITAGFSPEMVLMALGKPERIIPGNGPGEEDWIYVNVYSRDGRSIELPSKVTTGYGTTRLNPMAMKSKSDYLHLTFSADYDPSNEVIKAESAIKVHVKFTEGTVADIQIVSDGKG